MILAGVTFATANKINTLSSCANELLRCRVDRLMECLLCQYTQFEVSYCSLCTLFVFVHCVRSSPRREALRRAIINNSEYHKHDYNYRTRGSEERQRGEKKVHEMAHHASDTTRRRMSRTAEQSSPSSVLDLPTAEGGCHIGLVLNVSASRRPLRDCGAAGPSPRTQHCRWNSEETWALGPTTHHPAIKDQLSASKTISAGDVG